MSEPIKLGYVERLGLKLMIDARLREQHADSQGPHSQEGLLHGSALPWPPTVFRRKAQIDPLPTLDNYDRAS